MLDLAINHKEKLEKAYRKTIFDDKYKYFHALGYNDYTLDLKESNWAKLQYVSVYKDEVIGYITCDISRPESNLRNFELINFCESANIIFSKDLIEFFKILFIKNNYYKMRWSVAYNNPAKKLYEKFIKKYNGREVGVYKKEYLLADGTYEDCVLYELFREDFLKVFNSKKENIGTKKLKELLKEMENLSIEDYNNLYNKIKSERGEI